MLENIDKADKLAHLKNVISPEKQAVVTFTLPRQRLPEHTLSELPEEASQAQFLPISWVDWPGFTAFAIVFLFFAALVIKSSVAWGLLGVAVILVPYLILCAALMFGAFMLANYLGWECRFTVMVVACVCLLFPLTLPYLYP